MFLIELLFILTKQESYCKTSGDKMTCTNPYNLGHDDNIVPCDSSIKTVEITSGSDINIYGKAFTGCTALESVTINSQGNNPRLAIYDESFKSISSLKTLIIKGNSISISNSAFESTGLTKIVLENSTHLKPSIILKDRCFASIEGPVDLDLNVYHITLGGFQNSNVNSITIDTFGSVTIPDSAFENCKQIASINIKTTNSDISIGESSFKSATVESMTLKASKAIYFGKEVFLNGHLSSLKLSAGGTYAFFESSFKGIKELTEIEFLEDAGYVSFYQNSFESSGLKKLKLTSSVEVRLYTSSFQSCQSLESVEIASDRITVDTKAFFECSKLLSAGFKGEYVTYNSDSFSCTNLTIDKIKTDCTAQNQFIDGCYLGCNTQCADGSISNTPKTDKPKNKLSTGAIIGIAVGCVAVVGIVVGVLVWYFVFHKRKVGVSEEEA